MRYVVLQVVDRTDRAGLWLAHWGHSQSFGHWFKYNTACQNVGALAHAGHRLFLWVRFFDRTGNAVQRVASEAPVLR